MRHLILAILRLVYGPAQCELCSLPAVGGAGGRLLCHHHHPAVGAGPVSEHANPFARK